MLSWSAEESGQTVAISRLIGDGDVGIAADMELVRIGRASVGKDVDPSPVAAAAGLVGERSAVYAAAVAAAFELLNRAVDAAGLSVICASRKRLAHIIDALEMDLFPHAHV